MGIIDYDLWKLNQWVESIRQDINTPPSFNLVIRKWRKQ